MTQGGRNYRTFCNGNLDKLINIYKKEEQYVNFKCTESSPAQRTSLDSDSCGALLFFLGDDLRNASFSRSVAVALLSGSGTKQFMMKSFAVSDMHSGTLGWILNMPTLMGLFKGNCLFSFRQVYFEIVCCKKRKTAVKIIFLQQPCQWLCEAVLMLRSCHGNSDFLTCK